MSQWVETKYVTDRINSCLHLKTQNQSKEKKGRLHLRRICVDCGFVLKQIMKPKVDWGCGLTVAEYLDCEHKHKRIDEKKFDGGKVHYEETCARCGKHFRYVSVK